jgi:hypothetical protein
MVAVVGWPEDDSLLSKHVANIILNVLVYKFVY